MSALNFSYYSCCGCFRRQRGLFSTVPAAALRDQHQTCQNSRRVRARICGYDFLETWNFARRDSVTTFDIVDPDSLATFFKTA